MAQIQKHIDLEPYQTRFFECQKRFPGFVAAWGTGKTMTGLLKGVLLSQIYKNNLGLIVRRKYTDLRDSTMKDFTRYTGLHVPQSTKESVLPNGSVIMFRHGEELSGLQNVNLGWFYIEQAEEFPTEDHFDMLRGRLRREVELDPAFIFDESNAFYPLLCQLRDNPQRQGMIIANASGHNWVWKRWIKSPAEDYECVQATSFENAANLPADFVRDIRKLENENPQKYQQYVLNNHDEVDYEASYYAKLVSDLRAKKQITNVPHDPAGLVYTAWDLGFDCTVIIFFQKCGQERRVIDYYESTGKPISHYADVLATRKQERKYNYGRFFLPHDANQREMQTGLTLSKALKGYGYDVETIEREQNLDAGINRVMNMLPNTWIDEGKCEQLIDALEHYRREYDEENRCYRNYPLHDWSSHPSDALRIMSKAMESGQLNGSGMTPERVRQLREQYE